MGVRRFTAGYGRTIDVKKTGFNKKNPNHIGGLKLNSPGNIVFRGACVPNLWKVMISFSPITN